MALEMVAILSQLQTKRLTDEDMNGDGAACVYTFM